ncbi:hypothetical protein JCM3766R1_000996 [Sporobolomyces carnicolor]
MTSRPAPRSRSFAVSLVLAVFLSSRATVSALPGRFPCGTTSPNQQICDALSPASSPRTVGVPIGSECTSDNQCDFGQCTSVDGVTTGICVGGLGELCEGPDGPDDTLCAGNLGCQRTTSEGIVGKAVCGGSGADCSFEGAYQIGTRPNHSACISKHCSAKSLTCSTPNRPSPGRPQIHFDTPSNPKNPAPASMQRTSKIVIPSGSSCPTGFTVCPVAKSDGKGFEMACFDITNSATHCGGCPSIGAGFWPVENVGGRDCTAMTGVASSDCIDSRCRVFSCSPNYDFDRYTGTCKPKKYW